MGYFATDKPYPRGEMCTRGQMVIPGCTFSIPSSIFETSFLLSFTSLIFFYRRAAIAPTHTDYKDAAKSAEAVDSEHWLHSGDIASVDEVGRFKIVDRIKNLVKLSQGEYVALEKVENVCESCDRLRLWACLDR